MSFFADDPGDITPRLAMSVTVFFEEASAAPAPNINSANSF
jgi:hypothetical protein